ncbi:TetR/AcrR family transcriptional regulator [uncultured Tateyamaria sp.]|uniref:TetR/AcrR family transcriptional regulator n=1 Tax=uncultured Tateyamaria sp. TaxID=455651 RepID=UPI0026273546|nr:TetR/AcrR family transcriptional regulator [uncultured Tateyamaria sp.]
MTQSDEPKDTRVRIIEGAFKALNKEGLPPLSYDRIAAEAGVSRQLVRYHYEDPETLMVAICDFLANAYREALLQNAAQLVGSARLEMFLDFYFDLIDGVGKPRDDAVYDAMMSIAAGSLRVRENLRGQYVLLGQVLSHEFQLAHPELGKQSSEELSYLFVALMYGHWKMVASLGVSSGHNQLTRNAMDRLIQSYVDAGTPVSALDRVWSAEP